VVNFKNKTFLVTGGTGSFGRRFVLNFLKEYKNFKKIIIFSRDELKQYEMSRHPLLLNNKKIRFFLGDVRDKDRLDFALREVDYIIHAAALKQIDTAEYNPLEFIKTNVIGAQNIIETSIKNNVKKILALSTDKASSPQNLYGATKLCADKLFLAANNIKGKQNTCFSILRYGNVMMSRGSVIPKFLNIKDGKYPITNIAMTRFSLTLDQSVEFALFFLKNMTGSEIFVPKMNSYRIIDLVKAISGERKFKIKEIGIRLGEKINEELISIQDSRNTYEFKRYFLITQKKLKTKKVKINFNYSSQENSFYKIDEIKKLINNEISQNKKL
jgi:UDP-N-acetylglucosamine 4,6-dehydratase